MDKNIRYQKLMLKIAQQKDLRVIRFINKPDPVIEGFMAILKRKVLELVKVRA